LAAQIIYDPPANRRENKSVAQFENIA